MATEEMFTSLPTVATAQMTDIICAVQGYTSPSNLGLSVQETLQQVYNLFQSNVILYSSGNPNGTLAGTTFQFCWDTLDLILFICTVSGPAGTAVWQRADLNSGYATTVTAAGTTLLTVLSPYWQFFTGSTTQTVTMPVTTTLGEGVSWRFVNNSTGAVTIQSSGANTIATLASGQAATITCILNSGTTASSWFSTVTTSQGLGAFKWNAITGTSAAMASNNGYIANNSSLVTLSLPATSAVGDEIDVIGKGAGGWKVQCGAGQTVVVGSSSTSSGGSVSSAAAKDSFYIICTVANTEWTAGSAPESAGLVFA